MDSPLRESFLKAFANTNYDSRGEVILILDKIGPISWNAAYVEVQRDSDISFIILEELKNLQLIADIISNSEDSLNQE